MTIVRTVLLFGLTFGATALAEEPPATDSSVAHPLLGDAAAGKALFETTCAMCHGTTGEGDGPAGKSLKPAPRNFSDAELMSTLTDEHLIKVITKGGKSVGKSPLMPPWGKALGEQGVKDVAAYVRTFSESPAE